MPCHPVYLSLFLSAYTGIVSRGIRLRGTLARQEGIDLPPMKYFRALCERQLCERELGISTNGRCGLFSIFLFMIEGIRFSGLVLFRSSALKFDGFFFFERGGL